VRPGGRDPWADTGRFEHEHWYSTKGVQRSAAFPRSARGPRSAPSSGWFAAAQSDRGPGRCRVTTFSLLLRGIELHGQVQPIVQPLAGGVASPDPPDPQRGDQRLWRTTGMGVATRRGSGSRHRDRCNAHVFEVILQHVDCGEPSVTASRSRSRIRSSGLTCSGLRKRSYPPPLIAFRACGLRRTRLGSSTRTRSMTSRLYLTTTWNRCCRHVHHYRLEALAPVGPDQGEEGTHVLPAAALTDPKDAFARGLEHHRRIAAALPQREFVHGDRRHAGEIHWGQLVRQRYRVQGFDCVLDEPDLLSGDRPGRTNSFLRDQVANARDVLRSNPNMDRASQSYPRPIQEGRESLVTASGVLS